MRGYRFDPLFTTIQLGNLAPTDVVRYVMEVSVRGRGFETGGYARVGDPFDLAEGGSSIGFAVVPELGVALLLGSGLMALSRRARRR